MEVGWGIDVGIRPGDVDQRRRGEEVREAVVAGSAVDQRPDGAVEQPRARAIASQP